jgi:hypothetical protein
MKPDKANNIISNYKKSLAKGAVGETILRKQSWLVNSKAVIKYAYFTHIEDVIEREGKLEVDLRSEMTEEYKQLSYFVPDSIAENFGKKHALWQEKKNDPIESQRYKSSIREYIAYTHFIQNDNLFDEINDFIEELTGEKQ